MLQTASAVAEAGLLRKPFSVCNGSLLSAQPSSIIGHSCAVNLGGVVFVQRHSLVAMLCPLGLIACRRNGMRLCAACRLGEGGSGKVADSHLVPSARYTRIGQRRGIMPCAVTP